MNKVILVTGGNRGIGLEICRQLSKEGHKVIMGSRKYNNGLARKEEFGLDVDVQQLNVRKEKQIIELLNYITEAYGHLDVLINNAGIYTSNSGALYADMKNVRKTMKTNFFAPWRLIQAFYPLLKKSNDPRIINMSSTMGALEELSGNYAAYRISKSSLNALTILMANELGTPVKVNAMCPGWVRTDMGGPDASRTVEEGADTAVWLALSPDIPHGKFVRDRKVIPW